MVFNFDKTKNDKLTKKDKSNIGNLDTKIKYLCDKINSLKDYYTTSSCSGRIVLLKDEKRKMPDLFLYVTHDKINFKDFKKELEKTAGKNKGIVLFKQEPCVLTVACRGLEKAWDLYDKARNNAGWKKSGMMSISKNHMLELMSSETINFPIIKNGNILVDDKFLKIIIKKSNENLEKTWEKIGRLKGLI